MNEPREVPKTYQGTLRPRIYLLGFITREEIVEVDGKSQRCLIPDGYQLKIEWIEGDDVSKVVWTETIKVPQGHSCIPQIVCEGDFRISGAVLVDDDNTRHFVLGAETGNFNSMFTPPNLVKQ